MTLSFVVILPALLAMTSQTSSSIGLFSNEANVIAAQRMSSDTVSFSSVDVVQASRCQLDQMFARRDSEKMEGIATRRSLAKVMYLVAFWDRANIGAIHDTMDKVSSTTADPNPAVGVEQRTGPKPTSSVGIQSHTPYDAFFRRDASHRNQYSTHVTDSNQKLQRGT